MARAATAKIAKTPVTTGWVVKKSYTKSERDEKEGGRMVPKRFDKIVSKLFGSKTAAEAFCEIAKKYPQVAAGESNVDYYVTEHSGHDDLPAGL